MQRTCCITSLEDKDVKIMKKDGSYRFNLKFSCDSEKNIRAGELLEKCGNKKSVLIIEAVNEYILNHPEIEGSKNEIKIVKVIDNSKLPENWREEMKSLIEDYTTSNNLDNSEKKEAQGEISDNGLSQMIENLDAFVS